MRPRLATKSSGVGSELEIDQSWSSGSRRAGSVRVFFGRVLVCLEPTHSCLERVLVVT
jgi:hypothetical protein